MKRGKALLSLISPFCSNQDSGEGLAKKRLYREEVINQWIWQHKDVLFRGFFALFFSFLIEPTFKNRISTFS